MPIAREIRDALLQGSWIRKMFEEGAVLKGRVGAENVFDFTLGNPCADPPAALARELARLAADPPPDLHRYMPNAGFPDVRDRVAAALAKETGIPFTAGLVIMTVGAAGALNVALRTLLSPGDEVVVLAPYFVEYLTYIKNAGGVPVVAETDAAFQPDIPRIRRCLSPRTRALVLNTPNNPTGAVYPQAALEDIERLLAEHEGRTGTPVYVLSDEPYRKIVYPGARWSPPVASLRNVLVAYSHSKDLALPGERIGYLAVSPRAADAAEVAEGCVYCNRVLGFVNAPSLMQRAVAPFQEIAADVSAYRKNRDALVRALAEAGFDLVVPGGAFYLFPKAPGDDEMPFVESARKENILVVPGSGFGRKGHFRLAYCVPTETVERSLPAWKRLGESVFGGGRGKR